MYEASFVGFAWLCFTIVAFQAIYTYCLDVGLVTRRIPLGASEKPAGELLAVTPDHPSQTV